MATFSHLFSFFSFTQSKGKIRVLIVLDLRQAKYKLPVVNEICMIRI